jgi:hypothetical protein
MYHERTWYRDVFLPVLKFSNKEMCRSPKRTYPQAPECCPGDWATIADFQAVYTFSERSVGNDHHNRDLTEELEDLVRFHPKKHM